MFFIPWQQTNWSINWTTYFLNEIKIQLNPTIKDVKGLTHYICYWQISIIANKSNKTNSLKGPIFHIRYRWISIALGFVIARFLLFYLPPVLLPSSSLDCLCTSRTICDTTTGMRIERLKDETFLRWNWQESREVKQEYDFELYFKTRNA